MSCMRYPPLLTFAAVGAALAGAALLAGTAVSSLRQGYASCLASPVHYEPNPDANILKSAAWFETDPTTEKLVAYPFYWFQTGLGMNHVGRASIYTNGWDPKSRTTMKILWAAWGEPGNGKLLIKGTRLDAPGSFEQIVDGYLQFPSIIDIPAAGCWQLTLSSGDLSARMTIAAIGRSRVPRRRAAVCPSLRHKRRVSSHAAAPSLAPDSVESPNRIEAALQCVRS